MRGWNAIGCALLGVLASGCLSESHQPSDPVALDHFCGSFFDAVCGPLEGCGCGAATVNDCRAEEARLCAGFPSPALVRAVEEGRVIYDPVVAASLLDRLRARGCEGFVATLGWRVEDLFDLGGTFVGTGAAGATCEPLGFELISECAVGTCAPSSGGDTCRTSVDEGAACDRDHQCVDLDAPLENGVAIERLVLRCEPDAGGDNGVCRTWVPEGGACASAGECWTSRCEVDRCVTGAPGDACLSNRECPAGHYCSGLVCVAGERPDGDACDDAAACASRVCVGGICRPAGCDVF
ncbi:MAG: hypothetical protein KC619_21395 [Myxococcales bacterium]|nr:hypothetical protein [Myxococcales bacterium]